MTECVRAVPEKNLRGMDSMFLGALSPLAEVTKNNCGV